MSYLQGKRLFGMILHTCDTQFSQLRLVLAVTAGTITFFVACVFFPRWVLRHGVKAWGSSMKLDEEI